MDATSVQQQSPNANANEIKMLGLFQQRNCQHKAADGKGMMDKK